MKNNIKSICIALLVFVGFFAFVVSVYALETRVALNMEESVSLEVKNLSNPQTVISAEASTSSANILTKIFRKNIFGTYKVVGSTTDFVVANNIYIKNWDISGTKDTKASWTNTETSVGRFFIGSVALR